MVQEDTRKDTEGKIELGTWHWVEFYIKPNSNGLLTERRVWIDETLQFERVGRQNRWLDINGVYQTETIQDTDGDPSYPNSTDVINTVAVCTYWNGYAPKDQAFFIQDVAIHGDASALNKTDSFGNKIIGSTTI